MWFSADIKIPLLTLDKYKTPPNPYTSQKTIMDCN